MHNTLLLDGLGQRDCRGQSFRTLEIFEEKRTSGPMLETGDILFYIDKGEWAAVAGQFSQAYDTTRVASCVRQLLFIRPGTLLCIDHLHAPPGRTLPGVDWLLQLPGPPSLTPDGVAVANEKSQLLFKPLGLDLSRTPPTIQTTEVQTYTVSLPYNYPGSGATGEILLVHQIEVAPLTEASFRPATVGWRQETDHVDVTHNDKTYRFGLDAPWDVRLLDD